jgi:hypothetical protein
MGLIKTMALFYLLKKGGAYEQENYFKRTGYAKGMVQHSGRFAEPSPPALKSCDRGTHYARYADTNLSYEPD